MRFCIITDTPAITSHAVIGSVLRDLMTRHAVRLLNLTALSDHELTLDESNPPSDVYLLKSHSLRACKLGERLQHRGAVVINPASSTLACLDRLLMAQRIAQARLPYPRTWDFSAPEQDRFLATLQFPMMIKSRYSSRGDLVDKVRSLEHLRILTQQREQAPFVVQEFVHGDGSDVKIWVIGRRVFAARRATPLGANDPLEDFPIPNRELPEEWRAISLEVGRVFGLHLYGVDLLITDKGPVIVDVNPFPGFRGVPGAATALSTFLDRLGSEQCGIIRRAGIEWA